jgi:hypothetical protein
LSRRAQSQDLVWNVLLGIALVAIVALVVVGFYLPKAAGSKHQRSEGDRLADAAMREGEATHRLREHLRQKTWNMSPEAMPTSALDLMTQMARADHLELSEFRTQRVLDLVGLRQVQFSAVLEGRYVDVMSLLKALEAPESKLMVDVLQLSAADSHSDRVAANLSLAGFLLKETSK